MNHSRLEKSFRSLCTAGLTGTRRVIDDLFPAICSQSVQQAFEQGWTVDHPLMYCHRCGATAKAQGVTERGCTFCLEQKLAWDSVVRLGAYDLPLASWIVAMKFHHQWHWCNWFGHRLAEVIEASHETKNKSLRDVIAFVPMHWFRRQSRGFNQSELIAISMAKQLRWPLLPVLSRTRFTKPQTLIAPSARMENVGRSFDIQPVNLQGCRVWLVDDVKTTGSTLQSCAKLLRKAGAEEILLTVAAVADPAGQDFSVK